MSELFSIAGQVLGKPVDRYTGQAKTTGQATFTPELHREGMLYGFFVPATVPKGTIRSIDTQAAKALPGVAAILTYQDMPRLGELSFYLKKGTAGQTRIPMQSPQVAYAGEPVALVLADTLENAMWAAGQVRVAYDSVPHQTDMAANASRAVVVMEEKHGPAVEPILQKSALVVDQTYAIPTEHHNALEPPATLAYWEGDHLTVHEPIQWVVGLQRELSVRFSLPLENVRVLSKLVGGSFGSKAIPWPHTFLATAAARIAQRPVKLLLTREEMYWSIGYRAQVEQHVRLGADKQGKIDALLVTTRSRTSSFDQYYSPGLVHIPLMLWDVPAAKVTYQVVPTDVSTPVVMRAPGECEASFALNTALDELAAQIKIDPMELHLRNYAEKNPHTGKPFSSKALKACLAKTAEVFGWSRRNHQPGSMREKDTLVGWGMAACVYPVYQSPSVAKVRLRQDGSVTVQVATHELGTGVHTILAQTAAEALGISLERVTVETGDTALPPAPPSAGSRTTTSLTPAVYKAAGLVLTQLKGAANGDAKSPLKGVAPQQIRATANALYQVDDPTTTDAFEAIMARNGLPFLDGLGQHLPEGLGPEALSEMASGREAAQSQDEGRFSTYSFGAVMVEVRINAWTGMYQVSRIVGSYGIGRVLNPKTAASQIKGAIVMGLGMVRSEETLYDHRLGRIVNNNFADYHVPVQADTPAIDVHFVEETDPHIGPMGAKGAGEIGITGVAAAVVNAIYHATGRRIRELPITPEKLVLS